MSYYINDNLAKKLVELEMNNRRKAIKLADEIIPVIRKWDGKMFNKRLETALKEIDKHLWVKANSTFDIIWYPQDDSVRDEVSGSWAYVRTREFELNAYLSLQGYDMMALTSEKRIIADNIISAIEKRKRYLNETITDTESKLDSVDEYRAKLKQARTLVDEVEHDAPFLLQEYYGLRYANTY